jgi:hypothetical protein
VSPVVWFGDGTRRGVGLKKCAFRYSRPSCADADSHWISSARCIHSPIASILAVDLPCLRINAIAHMASVLKAGGLDGLQQPAGLHQFTQRLVDDLAVIEQAPLLAVDVACGETVPFAQFVKLALADSFGQRTGGL